MGTINAKEKAQLVDASLHEFTNQVTISVDRLTHIAYNYSKIQIIRCNGSNSVVQIQSI